MPFEMAWDHEQAYNDNAGYEENNDDDPQLAYRFSEAVSPKDHEVRRASGLRLIMQTPPQAPATSMNN